MTTSQDAGESGAVSGQRRLEVPKDLERALRRAVEEIVRVAKPEAVILFGSYAEGRAGEGSDVDLLVVAETADRFACAGQLAAAVRPLLAPWSLDLIVVPASEWPRARRIRGFVTYEADRWGVRLYERAA